MDDPDQLNRDTEAARVAFEKFLLAPYDNDATPHCDDKAGDGCKDPAEWAGVCNGCRGSMLLCGPHYNTHSVASSRFGLQVRCSVCGNYGPMSETFTFALLRSPS